jgi:chromosome segregation ATPase
MAITKERIWQVAEALVAAGENPTLAAIRKQLGGGSFTTLSEALKEWRQQIQQKPVSEMVILPETIQTRILDFSKVLWQSALETAQAEVEYLKTEVEAREQTALQECAEAQALAVQVETELEQAKARIVQLEAICHALEMKTHETQIIAAEREQRIRMLEQELHTARTANEQRNDEAIQTLAVQMAALQKHLVKPEKTPTPKPPPKKR